jgi:hypothetical protein
MRAIIAIIAMTSNTNVNPPHNGSVTSHHDQLITLHSFNIIKATPNKVNNPIPPPLELLEFDIYLLFVVYLFGIIN